MLILCLVSKENATGKNTFAKWLQRIFSQNFTIISNAEISNDFNAHLGSKLVVAIKPAIGRPYIFKAIEVLDKYEYEEFASNTIENEENSLAF